MTAPTPARLAPAVADALNAAHQQARRDIDNETGDLARLQVAVAATTGRLSEATMREEELRAALDAHERAVAADEAAEYRAMLPAAQRVGGPLL